ncbi:hypothetical protein BH09ACT1_BH09ACT1_16990 [soil metagenome]
MHHPDLAGGAGEAVTLRLNAAKYTLLDTERRAIYDQALWRGAKAASPQAPERPAPGAPPTRPSPATGRRPAPPSTPRVRDHRSVSRERGSHPAWAFLSLGALVAMVTATTIIFAACYRAPFALDNPRLVPLIGIALAWLDFGMRKPPVLVRLAVLGSGLLLPLFAARIPVAVSLADAVSPLVLVALSVASLAVGVSRFSSRRVSAAGAHRHAARERISFDMGERMS